MGSIVEAIGNMLAQEWVKSLFWAVVLFAVTGAVAKVVTKTLRHLLQRDNNPLPNASIFVNIARTTVWLIGGSIILDSCFGLNTSSLVTALGIGGIAVSLGFQDTLSNLIGGLQVTFMGIIKPGDNIEVGGSSGVVQDVTWRHTTIRDTSGQTVVIPNSIISKTALSHLLPANRVTVPFTVARAAFALRASVGAGADANAGADGLAARVDQPSLDALAKRLAADAKRSADGVSPVISGPNVYFSEITELGIKGKIIFQVEDASKTALAADAVVRAIAPTLE